MTDAQAAALLASLFLVAGLVSLFWPEWLLSRVNRKGAGTWRMRVILAPFPEKHHRIVVRVVGAISLLVAVIAFSEAWMRK